MTAAEWLQLDDDTLAAELAKVLVPGPWEHVFVKDDGDVSTCHCVKCGGACHGPNGKCWRGQPVTDTSCSFYTDGNMRCPIPDPIDITSWGAAMKIYRNTDHSMDCMEKLHEVVFEGVSLYDAFSVWLSQDAQPKHFLIAAAMAAEGSKE